WRMEFVWKQWDATIRGDPCEERLRDARYTSSLLALGQKSGYLVLHYMRPSDAYHVKGQTFRHGRALQASFDNRRWLRTIQRGHNTDPSELPLYLWDREFNRTRKTIEILTEEVTVDYTCISHTWGRWKKSPETVANLAGVDWAIPENTIFDVTDLSNILARTPANTRFLWFDLVCLPQDINSPEYAYEVSRQAIIFYHASACIAWLNQISSWNNMQSCIQWLALHCLQQSTEGVGDMYDVAPLLAQMKRSVEHGTIELRKDGLHPYNVDPWLSSTWTLQETVLCPDMILCNREWEPLDLVPGTHISLHSLLQLPNADRRFSGAYVKFQEPSHAQVQMRPVRVAVNGPGRQIDRCAILDLGARRACQTRRADAVMSALGMTDWYDEYLRHHGVPPPDDDLVLGSYPLPFVKEAAAKMGAEFFCCSCTTYDKGAIWPPGPPYHGTFLPFGSPQNDYGLLGSSEGLRFRTHPSLMSWSIEADASVNIPEASVLVSSSRYPIDLFQQIDAKTNGRGVPEHWSGQGGTLLLTKFSSPFRDPLDDAKRLWNFMHDETQPEAQPERMGIVLSGDESNTVVSVLESLEEHRS
ncbi:hypothetical protein diail_7937, partial [Diaporthe ilicicola]